MSISVLFLAPFEMSSLFGRCFLQYSVNIFPSHSFCGFFLCKYLVRPIHQGIWWNEMIIDDHQLMVPAVIYSNNSIVFPCQKLYNILTSWISLLCSLSWFYKHLLLLSKLLLSSPIELFQLFVDIDLFSFHFFNFSDCYVFPLANAFFLIYVFYA